VNRVGALVSVLIACSVPAGSASGGAAVPCEPRDLGFGQKQAGWKPHALSKLKRDTVYSLAQEDGRTVLRAAADRSASIYAMRFKSSVAVPAILSWRWKTDALVPGADNREKSREDAPLRVILGFDGDVSTLPAAARGGLVNAHLPYAVLMYVWSDRVAVESVIQSTHTSRIRMLVVASGTGGLGSWQAVRRNLAEDYRRAFGSEPGRMLGIAVMTDTDNTGTKAVGRYADIRFECDG
jgi:hypothetical protein